MEESLYTKAVVLTAGTALILFIDWYVFRTKNITFRIKYHPLMMLVGSFMFGVLGAVVIFDKSSPIWVSGLYIVGSLAVGIVDIIKRQICTKCGHETNELAINGLFTRFEYCPKCGASYKVTSSK